MSIYSNIKICRACGGSLYDDYKFSMEAMAVCGKLENSEKEAVDNLKIPLDWVECVECTLTQVLQDVNDSYLYNEYNYSSSQIPGLKLHFTEYANKLITTYKEQIRFLEVGCNDGVLLNQLPSEWSKIGVDPSDVAKQSENEKYTLIKHSIFVGDGLG